MKIVVLITVERDRVQRFTFENDTVTYGTGAARRTESIEEWKTRFPQHVESDGTIQFGPEFDPLFAIG